ncbi:MAP/microtubule affinity-regulating kinase 4-like [Oxyura jamaicensis]|uniref:MAP/microtubule affinity-regulating kinase 4-like n=1 Tax=Oxyura jamaicensis TaxID=8884 RepID=UPI0015A606E8|nr:MAP/microtubule affinity-regulating kinase 4-like [Oxyura jamaicensis]
MVALREATLAAGCRARQPQPFLLSCTHDRGPGELFCHFEAEVCRLQRLGTHGVLFRRLAGTAGAFRDTLARVAGRLQL